jgi:hypothetical protein
MRNEKGKGIEKEQRRKEQSERENKANKKELKHKETSNELCVCVWIRNLMHAILCH